MDALSPNTSGRLTLLTVTSVVIDVTSFGVLFYLFVLVAGATLDGCPYQTPWTHVIHRLLHLFINNSALYGILLEIWGHPDKYKITITILMYPLVLLAAVALDAFRLERMTFRSMQVVSALKARSWLCPQSKSRCWTTKQPKWVSAAFRGRYRHR